MTVRNLLGGLLCLLLATPAWAVDSYRYMHVTIETPWHIFLGLLVAVLSPFILMAFLYWRFALRKPPQDKKSSEHSEE